MKVPIVPFHGMYDEPSPKGMGDRRESWQDLTKKPSHDDSLVDGKNPQDNPTMLTPGRHVPDPTPEPDENEQYHSVLR